MRCSTTTIVREDLPFMRMSVVSSFSVRTTNICTFFYFNTFFITSELLIDLAKQPSAVDADTGNEFFGSYKKFGAALSGPM